MTYTDCGLPTRLVDGWNELRNGDSVLVQNGRIVRATTYDNNRSLVAASVYEGSKYGGMDNICPVSVREFRRKWSAGKLAIR